MRSVKITQFYFLMFIIGFCFFQSTLLTYTHSFFNDVPTIQSSTEKHIEMSPNIFDQFVMWSVVSKRRPFSTFLNKKNRRKPDLESEQAGRKVIWFLSQNWRIGKVKWVDKWIIYMILFYLLLRHILEYRLSFFFQEKYLYPEKSRKGVQPNGLMI